MARFHFGSRKRRTTSLSVPNGACLAHGAAAQVFKPGSHGSTFSGNPLVCRVALTVIDELEKGQLAQRAAVLGEHLLNEFKKTLGDVAGVKEIRGRGLMIAIELDRPCQELTLQALQHGLLINVTADKVIRLLPPLILSDADAELLTRTLSDVVRRFLVPK